MQSMPFLYCSAERCLRRSMVAAGSVPWRLGRGLIDPQRICYNRTSSQALKYMTKVGYPNLTRMHSAATNIPSLASLEYGHLHDNQETRNQPRANERSITFNRSVSMLMSVEFPNKPECVKLNFPPGIT